jgi:hypothetical protein
MKKVVKLSFLSVLMFFGLVGFVNDVSAKKIQINTTVKDANGKTWEIKGWIEVEMCCPPSLKHWDLWVTDGEGKKHHFVGLAYQSGNGGKTGNESNGYKMNVYSETGLEEPLEVIPFGSIIVEMKKITANANE